MVFCRFILLFTLLACGVNSSFAIAAEELSATQKLQAVKHKIAKQQTLLAKQKKTQAKLAQALRKVETAVANSAKALFSTNTKQTQVSQKQRQLIKQQKSLEQDKTTQQQALSKQLKSAYMTGSNNVVQLILNQRKSAETERLLGYYHYLNKARVESITRLKKTLAQLNTIKEQLNVSAQQLQQLKQQQQSHEKTLNQEKNSRRNALSALKKSYLKNSTELEKFQLAEIDIKQLMIKPEPIKARALDGLAKFKRKLPRPSIGKVVHHFGSKRHGQLRWKGITISGDEGQSVKAIHHGKVIYSDWIRGFGLVLVLDHGKGYMSLYGHNQALLKNAGDSVLANESIALLGQSGGQSQPALYFEIRYKGKAVNPARWLLK